MEGKITNHFEDIDGDECMFEEFYGNEYGLKIVQQKVGQILNLIALEHGLFTDGIL